MNCEDTEIVEIDKIYGGKARIIWGYFHDNQKLGKVEKIDETHDTLRDESHSSFVDVDLFPDEPKEGNIYRASSKHLDLWSMGENIKFVRSIDEERAIKQWSKKNLP